MLFWGISPHMTEVWGLELVARLWMAELDTIKGINYNQACNGAIGIELICKMFWGLRGKKEIFDRRHVCV